jgi:hypothetical protein
MVVILWSGLIFFYFWLLLPQMGFIFFFIWGIRMNIKIFQNPSQKNGTKKSLRGFEKVLSKIDSKAV